ncbi:hypothetical protein RN001_012597 [Aquatica leii]|uniref:Tetratricopeptide repeat protein 8 n=1 Tax=Aquatica leii TaxID=1421715 RepID=A0AAN7NYM7_9COLE|nr:hypothetical protein RN001_012597 [Aquatica leii]
MEPFYLALSYYRRRNFDKCAETCTEILDKQPLDQAAWCLKMKALTKRVYIDDLDSEEVIAGDFLDNDTVASAPRPGTSMKVEEMLKSRPRSTTGRPISGINRPGTQARPGSSIERLKTARPLTGQSVRAIRLGTAAIYSQRDGPFIQVSRLNLTKYAKQPCLSKPLFEYLFYHEGDVRNAMELAVQATQANHFEDWWWKVQLAKCYNALNLIRDSEQQLRSALKQHNHIETYIRLIRIYLRLDQPLSALEVCKAGLTAFPNDVSISTEVARLYEELGDATMSVKHYRNIVIEDAMNTEAIACIGVYHFYNNQPELALRYYRRVLAMGVHSAELYNNLGLCCLYSQQLDLTMACLQRALDLAISNQIKAEVWYNLSHVAIAAGDVELAMQCLSICLVIDPTHAPAFNNIAILQYKSGRANLAKAYFTTAKNLQENMLEPQKNLEYLQNKYLTVE